MATPSSREACPTPAPDTPPIQIEVAASLDYAELRIVVAQTTTFRNETGGPLSEIVFYVAQNAQPGEFTLQDLRLSDGADAPPARLEGVRLTVPLAVPWNPTAPRSSTCNTS